jgi:hypothetical protein
MAFSTAGDRLHRLAFYVRTERQEESQATLIPKPTPQGEQEGVVYGSGPGGPGYLMDIECHTHDFKILVVWGDRLSTFFSGPI